MGKFTDQERQRAIQRGMEFIYRIACDPQHLVDYGCDLLFFFNTIAATSKDTNLRKMARKMANDRFRHWQHERQALPPDPDADTITDFVLINHAAQRIGIRDPALKRQLREAAKNFTATDFLWFDPYSEAPPSNVSQICECGTRNKRGRKICSYRRCKAELMIMSPYLVWYYSLGLAYCGESYGVPLGARYLDVFRWLPTVRSYRGRKNGRNPDFSDMVYMISHIVYTLNDYGMYKLSPRWLPQEYEFLKANIKEAIVLEDPDMMGEFLDSLMAFGLKLGHPLIREGMSFLLSQQNPDGSWGDMEDEDLYGRYHPTWAAIDGLREYAWRGERLKFPQVMPLLKQWANKD
jgi:hypothetical protein